MKPTISIIFGFLVTGPLWAGSFHFTKFVDSTTISTIGLYNVDINDAGDITFVGSPSPGYFELYKIHSGEISLVTSGIGGINLTTINNAGTVAFQTNQGTFTDAAGFVSPSAGGSAVGLNNYGVVTYTDGSQIYRIIPGTSQHDESGPMGRIFFGPRINDAGTVVFETFDAGVSKLISLDSAGKATTALTLTDSGFDIGTPAINNAGQIAFTFDYSFGGRNLSVWNNGSLIPIASTTTPDGAGEFRDLTRTADINDSGQVVFYGSTLLGAQGLFLADANSGAIEPLIQSGDTLFGSVARPFPADDGAINNHGQIAFAYQLENGTYGIAVATPDASSPEPGSSLLFLGALTGIAVLRQRASRR